MNYKRYFTFNVSEEDKVSVDAPSVSKFITILNRVVQQNRGKDIDYDFLDITPLSKYGLRTPKIGNELHCENLRSLDDKDLVTLFSHIFFVNGYKFKRGSVVIHRPKKSFSVSDYVEEYYTVSQAFQLLLRAFKEKYRKKKRI